MRKAEILILSGVGINAESELERGFRDAGALVSTILLEEFLKDPGMLLKYNIFALPGGFSFGDEVRSGKILAEKMRSSLSGYWDAFLSKRGLVLGICNGFQVLMQLGVFENRNRINKETKRTITLNTNNHGEFRNFWTELEITSAGLKTPWFKNCNREITLPVRHKEGKILCAVDHQGISTMPEDMKVVLKYKKNINGSLENIAGVVDLSGQILGLMPHPEVALESFLHPLFPDLESYENTSTIKKFFTNAIHFAEGSYHE